MLFVSYFSFDLLQLLSSDDFSCIKNIFGWTDDYVLANEEAVKLRNEFRSNMHLPPGKNWAYAVVSAFVDVNRIAEDDVI